MEISLSIVHESCSRSLIVRLPGLRTSGIWIDSLVSLCLLLSVSRNWNRLSSLSFDTPSNSNGGTLIAGIPSTEEEEALLVLSGLLMLLGREGSGLLMLLGREIGFMTILRDSVRRGREEVRGAEGVIVDLLLLLLLL